MNRMETRAWILLLVVAILLGGFAVFLTEYFTNGKRWIEFSGSPHIYSGGSAGCGVVVDREKQLLLDLNDGRSYGDSALLRSSTVHWLGDRYGNISTPTLYRYASQLAGFDYYNGVYSYGQKGGMMELTLSAKLQMAALEAMGSQKGTVAVFNYKTGQILCAVTTPTYDPDNAPTFAEGDSAYEGLYVNRFTQSTYTPGSIFKLVTLAAALENDPGLVERIFFCAGQYTIGAGQVVCEGSHGTQSLKDAFCNSCNCAFAQITLELGAEKLKQYADKFGILSSLSFDGITTAAGNLAPGTDLLNLAWSGVGQHLDLINPCVFLTFVGAVANDGKMYTPYLVEEISVDWDKTYQAEPQTGTRILSSKTAATLREYMLNNVQTKYGADNFPGITVGAKTGTAEIEGQKPNAMLIGFVDNLNLPLAFIVCVEDGGYGKTVCIPIVAKILAEAEKLSG